MISIAALLPLVTGQTELLWAASRYYGSLKRFEATIEHSDSSGLFPGKYTQKLVWTGPGKFTLKVVKPSSAKVKAPDYIADGQIVKSIQNGKTIRQESAQPRPMTSPGWEVCGGLALALLQKTPSSKMILNTPKEFKLTWKRGPTKSWKGVAVRELIGSFDKKETIHLFFDAAKPAIVGMQSLSGPKGWMIYRNIDVKLAKV